MNCMCLFVMHLHSTCNIGYMYTVCVGDAASRSGGPTGGSTVGRLSVCSHSFLRDGQQPALIRSVLCLCVCFSLSLFLQEPI